MTTTMPEPTTADLHKIIEEMAAQLKRLERQVDDLEATVMDLPTPLDCRCDGAVEAGDIDDMVGTTVDAALDYARARITDPALLDLLDQLRYGLGR